MIGKQEGKRRALFVVCGVILFFLLVVEMTTGCGRKKPPRPLDPGARLILYLAAYA